MSVLYHWNRNKYETKTSNSSSLLSRHHAPEQHALTVPTCWSIRVKWGSCMWGSKHRLEEVHKVKNK
eukprot:6200210-Amphidinium_carterae.1